MRGGSFGNIGATIVGRDSVGTSLFSCRQLAQRFHVVTVAHPFDLAGLLVDYNTVRQLDVQADDGEVFLAPVLLPLVRPDPIRPAPREVTRAAPVWLPIHVRQQVAPQVFRPAHLCNDVKLRFKIRTKSGVVVQ